jgi:hypothetical protein
MKSTLQREMRKWFKEHEGYYPITSVYCEIYGKPMYLNEMEVRYLQVKCIEWTLNGKFEEFCENHKVWSGRFKRHSKHQMIFQKNGLFQNGFENGFYSANSSLAISVFSSCDEA